MYMKILQLIFSGILVIFCYFSLNSPLYNFFTVKLPISIKGGFPVPAIFWLGVVFYATVVSFIFKKEIKNTLGLSVVYGFLLHLLFMLLKLKVQIAQNPHIFASAVYTIYCELFILVSLLWLVLFCAREFFRLDSFSAVFFSALVYSLGFLYLNGFILQSLLLVIIFTIGLYVFRNKQIVVFIRKGKDSVISLWNREKFFLGVILFGGIIIRLFYLWRIMLTPDYINAGSDGPLYDGLAWSFSRGERVTEPLVSGYWMFLALLYKIFGRNYALVCAVQGILTSFAYIFVYYSAKYIFNKQTARIAAMLAALSFSSIFSSVAIGHQALDIFYSTLSLMLVCRYALGSLSQRARFFLLIGIGITFGLSIVTREANLFYPFMVMAWFIIILREKFSFSVVIRDAGLVLLIMGLTLTPFIWRNIKNLGVWYPVSSAQGANYPLIEAYLKGENPELVKAGIDLSRPDLLLELAVKRPIFVGRIFGNNLWNKFKAVYFSQGYGGFDMLFLYRMSGYYYALWFYVYILTIWGVICAFRQYKLGPHLLIFLFIFNRTVVHMLTESQYRHRSPIDPFLILYFSFGVYCFIRMWSENRKHAN